MAFILHPVLYALRWVVPSGGSKLRKSRCAVNARDQMRVICTRIEAQRPYSEEHSVHRALLRRLRLQPAQQAGVYGSQSLQIRSVNKKLGICAVVLASKPSS